MNDTIYRKDAIQALVDTEEIKGFAYRMLEDRLMEIPSADKPSGEWIPMQVSSGRDSWKCSVCGRRARGKIENLPYCHCGARMKGTENNKECHKPESLYYRAFCEEQKNSAYCDGCEFWY